MKRFLFILILPFVFTLYILSRDAPQPDQTATVHFIDVGSGDATLIELPCGNILVDAGGTRPKNKEKFRRYLVEFFAERPRLSNQIDMMILSHSHFDHTSNIVYVLENHDVENFFWNGRKTFGQQQIGQWLKNHDSQQHTIIDQDMPAGVDTLPPDSFLSDCAAGAEIQFLWGNVRKRPGQWSKKQYHDENNHSIVVKISYGEVTLLFPGDLEVPGLRMLAKKYAQSTLDVDLLKISHHGYKSGTTTEFVRLTSPELAVLSRSDRPWYEKTFEIYENLIPNSRKRPLPIVVWNYEPVERGERPGYDENSQKIRWGINYGEKSARLITKAIYSTGLDGHIVVNVSPDGNMSVKNYE